MRPRISMREALAEPELFGRILAGFSWYGWRVLLIAAAGEELTDDERQEFKRLTSREREPSCLCRELVVVAGRRAGKSTAVVVFDIWIAALCDHRGTLAPGETGVALLISRDQRVARMLLDRIYGIMSSSEPLNSMIVNRTADTIELRNGISIEVRPCSYKTLRGPTFISVICDELAFWFTSADFANPDTEVLTAVRPGLITTDGPVLMVSSAYAKRGELYEAYRKYFGPNGAPDVLVAFGTSRDLNPSLPQAEIDRALEKDPVRNRAEFLSEFRDDITGFIPREIVEACVGDYHELPPNPGICYRCFVDAASGVPEGDSYAIAIAHKLGDRVVIDAIREVRPPFSPSEVVSSYCSPCARPTIFPVSRATTTPVNILRRLFAPSVSVMIWPRSIRPISTSILSYRCSTPEKSICRATNVPSLRFAHWSAQCNGADASRLATPPTGTMMLPMPSPALLTSLTITLYLTQVGVLLMGRMKPTPSASSTSLMRTFAGGWATTCGALAQVGS